ncbi:DMT family transporter [Paraburkholderia bannensis]|uniref:DMT family transporter n=1 Tax=Paraburkholderia bannensis TaxID=765414 RepID=UPI002AB75D8B|nr:DMT family transporter [Paraburkholderia bannensis]
MHTTNSHVFLLAAISKPAKIRIPLELTLFARRIADVSGIDFHSRWRSSIIRASQLSGAVQMVTKTALLSALPLAAALLAGTLIPVQAASSGTLGRILGSPVWGAAIALFIGAIALVIAGIVMRVPMPAFAVVSAGPWWMWIGGITGAVYVVTCVALIPRTGAGTFLVCVVAGQMLAALLLDHFGLLGLATRPATLGRAAGILVMFAGILITQLTVARPAKVADAHVPTLDKSSLKLPQD